MSERTIGTNRLIDGEKIDAIILNEGDKISATSLGNGGITDTEFSYLDNARSNLQAQIDAMGGTSGTSMEGTTTYDGTCVINTNGSMTVRYCPTYIETLINGQTTSRIEATGTYNAGTGQMVYTNGITVGTDGTVSGTDKIIAFTNTNNEFKAGFTNVFKGDVVYTGSVSFPYYNIGTGEAPTTLVYDAKNGINQKATVNGTGTITLNFENMTQNTYSLDLVVNNSISLAIGTITDSGTVTGKHALAGQTFPMDLGAGTHIILIKVAELKIHVGVLQSDPI